jgi:hypothetical protein
MGANIAGLPMTRQFGGAAAAGAALAAAQAIGALFVGENAVGYLLIWRRFTSSSSFWLASPTSWLSWRSDPQAAASSTMRSHSGSCSASVSWPASWLWAKSRWAT